MELLALIQYKIRYKERAPRTVGKGSLPQPLMSWVRGMSPFNNNDNNEKSEIKKEKKKT